MKKIRLRRAFDWFWGCFLLHIYFLKHCNQVGTVYTIVGLSFTFETACGRPNCVESHCGKSHPVPRSGLPVSCRHHDLLPVLAASQNFTPVADSYAAKNLKITNASNGSHSCAAKKYQIYRPWPTLMPLRIPKLLMPVMDLTLVPLKI